MRAILPLQKQQEIIRRAKGFLSWKEFADAVDVPWSSIHSSYHQGWSLPYELYQRLDNNNEYIGIVRIENDNWGRSKGGKLCGGHPKVVSTPEHCVELAEICGAILGDGNIQPGPNYCIKIAGDKRYEKEYFQYLSGLVSRLFGVDSFYYEDPKRNSICIHFYSKQVCQFFVVMGIPYGNKSKVRVPGWILRDTEYMKACVRGLMDTDGGVHYISKKDAHLKRLSYTSNNGGLLEDMFNMLSRLGYYCCLTRNKIYISRQVEIIRFLNEIGFSNKKHKNRLLAL